MANRQTFLRCALNIVIQAGSVMASGVVNTMENCPSSIPKNKHQPVDIDELSLTVM